jgi:hypothetical protein
MECTNLEQMIAEAEQRVALGEYYILRQRAAIAKLEGDGHDGSEAKDVLAGFLARQEQQVSARDWLLKEFIDSKVHTQPVIEKSRHSCSETF